MDGPASQTMPSSSPDRRKLSLEQVIENELKSGGGVVARESHASTTLESRPPPVKISILERALTEVFPEPPHKASENAGFGYPGNYNLEGGPFPPATGDSGEAAATTEEAQLYNPKKSPLKNRNEILRDILGISG